MNVNRGVLAGLVVVVLWASAFPAIQVAVPAFGVIGLSFVRLAVATVALVAFAAIKRIRLPQPRDLGWVLVAGFFGMTAYQLLLNASELRVPAGTASIIVAAAPLVSVAVAFLLFREPVTRYTVVGSLVALAAYHFKQLGFTNVRVLDGGLQGWRAAGYELFQDVNSYAKAFGELVESRRHTPSLSAEEVAGLIA